MESDTTTLAGDNYRAVEEYNMLDSTNLLAMVSTPKPFGAPSEISATYDSAVSAAAAAAAASEMPAASSCRGKMQDLSPLTDPTPDAHGIRLCVADGLEVDSPVRVLTDVHPVSQTDLLRDSSSAAGKFGGQEESRACDATGLRPGDLREHSIGKSMVATSCDLTDQSTPSAEAPRSAQQTDLLRDLLSAAWQR